MKPAIWPLIMALCLVGTGLGWVLTLTPGLPASVYLYEAGRLMALLGFVLVSFQYLWVSRFRFVQAGMTTGRHIRLHRRWGAIALVLLVLHPLCLVVSETLQGYSPPLGVFKMLGVVALVFAAVAGGAALLARRLRLKVRTWKGIHRLAYAVFPIAFAHAFLLGTTLQKTTLRAGWACLALLYLAPLCAKIFRRASRGAASGPKLAP